MLCEIFAALAPPLMPGAAPLLQPDCLEHPGHHIPAMSPPLQPCHQAPPAAAQQEPPAREPAGTWQSLATPRYATAVALHIGSREQSQEAGKLRPKHAMQGAPEHGDSQRTVVQHACEMFYIRRVTGARPATPLPCPLTSASHVASQP